MLVCGLCFWRLEIDAGDFKDAWAGAYSFLSRFFPADFRAVHHYRPMLIESLAMSVWGTGLAASAAFASTILGARNFSPSNSLYVAMRGLMSLARVIPDVIFAIVCVFAFGPGPLAGTVTIFVSCFGQLSKQWNEALERIDPSILEAAGAVGASKFQLLRFCGWPSVSSEVWGFVMYGLDRAIREAVVIGIVGAGGIGMELSLDMRLFEYQRATTVILMIVSSLLLSEMASNWCRSRLQ